MALNTQKTNLAVNTEADALTTLSGSGLIRIYDGTQPATGGGPDVSMPYERKRKRHARDYDFLESVKVLRKAALSRSKLGVKPPSVTAVEKTQSPKTDSNKDVYSRPLEQYVPLSFTGMGTLLAGAQMTAAQLQAQAEANAMWAKAIMAMEADKTLRSEEDELFMLLCAAVVN